MNKNTNNNIVDTAKIHMFPLTIYTLANVFPVFDSHVRTKTKGREIIQACNYSFVPLIFSYLR